MRAKTESAGPLPRRWKSDLAVYLGSKTPDTVARLVADVAASKDGYLGLGHTVPSRDLRHRARVLIGEADRVLKELEKQKEPDAIFVYGELRSGGDGHWMMGGADIGLRYVGHGRVRGRLVAHHKIYRGLELIRASRAPRKKGRTRAASQQGGREQWVYGEVYTAKNLDQLLAVADGYEEAYGAQKPASWSLYRRERLDVLVAVNEWAEESYGVRAWGYLPVVSQRRRK